jgi:hypothetical protein
MLNYFDVEKEFFQRAIDNNCTLVQLEKMKENFSDYFNIAIMQYKTVKGIDLYAYDSIEKMLYYIRQVIRAVRSMRYSTGKKSRECLDIMLEEGRIGYRQHYQKKCYIKITKKIKLETDLLKVRDTSKHGLTKTDIKILWLDFFDKVLSNKQRLLVKSDILKSKDFDKYTNYLNSSTIRVRYSRILQKFALYMNIDKSKKLGNLSSVEFLLTLDAIMQ